MCHWSFSVLIERYAMDFPQFDWRLTLTKDYLQPSTEVAAAGVSSIIATGDVLTSSNKCSSKWPLSIVKIQEL
jgi:hypothetical protein